MRPHVGSIASSDTFYDPDPERHKRWGERGVLAVEMEAAVLFTIGGLRRMQTACLLTVSDLVYGETFERIGDDELAAGVERMCRLAIARGGRPQVTAVMIVNPASDSGGTAKAWPGIAEGAKLRGIDADVRLTTAPGHATELTREALTEGARLIVAVGGDGTISEVANGFFDGERAIAPEAGAGGGLPRLGV